MEKDLKEALNILKELIGFVEFANNQNNVEAKLYMPEVNAGKELLLKHSINKYDEFAMDV